MRQAAVLVVVLVVACGDDGLAINATGDNFCDQIAAVACHDMFQCCSESEIERDLGVTDPRTEDECKIDFARLCERTAAPYTTALKNGTVKFDGAPMNECLKSLVAPADTCATVDSMTPWAMACMTSAWSGTVATGSTCHYKFECAGGLDSYCAANQTCMPLPTDGQPCTTLGCASGLYCGLTDRLCHGLGGAGSMCNSIGQCAKGFYCDFTANQCAALHGPGETCNDNTACTSNKCLPGTCSNNGVACLRDTQCQGHCSISTGISCSFDYNCGSGMCSMTATTCFLPGDCTGVGNVCNYPQMCLPSTCVGPIVCGDNTLTIDYCKDSLSNLPIPR